MKRTLMIAAIAAALTGGVASAEEGAFELQIDARQGNMAYRALQLGVLGAMAKGEAEYNAEAAQKAADNLLAAVTMDASMLWPQGSDSDALPDETAALPAIWADGSDIGAKVQAMTDAATAMQAAAGTGLEPLQAAMDAVGGACGGCHKAFRKPAS
jgi:cytochrome c556